MRSRTFREGSVGLLLLAGVGMFGLMMLWLNRVTAARNSYKAIVEFANAGGMQRGAVVRYRGVKVGRIAQIKPGANHVDVEIEITDPNLIIPNNVRVEANQSGLISESIIDITPLEKLPLGLLTAKPLDKDCNPQIIVCNGSRLRGQIGISLDELIRTTTELATIYTDKKFYTNVNRAVENTAVAAASVAELTRNLTLLSKSLQQEIRDISTTSIAVQRATNQLSTSSTATLNQISATANQFGSTANEFGATAREIRLTTTQVNRLINNLDTLVTNNRSSLVAALNNITAASSELRQTVGSLSPTVNRVTQGEILQNLETLAANAAQASTNLRDVTNSLNTPNNLLVLQQTLDSARVTFENVQKITSDLDDLTGDPTFRENLRQLVNGLSGLVSSTQQMQQQVQIASTLDSVKAAIHNPQAEFPAVSAKPQMIFSVSPTALNSTSKTPSPTSIIFSTPTAVKFANKQPQPVSTLTPSSSHSGSPSKILPPTSIIFSTPTAVKLADTQPQPTSTLTPPTSQENLLKLLREHREERK